MNNTGIFQPLEILEKNLYRNSSKGLNYFIKEKKILMLMKKQMYLKNQ